MTLPLAFLAGVGVSLVFPYAPRTVLFAAAAIAILAVFRGMRLRPALLCALALGAVYPAAHGLLFSPPPIGRGEQVVRGYFPESRAEGGSCYREFFVEDAGDTIDICADTPLETGVRYSLLIDMKGGATRLNPGMLARQPGALLRRVIEEGGEVSSLNVRINGLRDRIDRGMRASLSPGAAALASAMTTGRRAPMGWETRAEFRRAGLAHLLSISGTHFAFFSLAVFGVLSFALGRLPYAVLLRMGSWITPRGLAAMATLPFLVLYLGISGASVPASRAFVMISLFLGGLLLGRRGQWLNTLAIAAVVLVLLDPKVVTTISFVLSFTAVLFIGMAVGGRTEGVPEVVEGLPSEPSPARTAFRRLLQLLVVRPGRITLAALAGVAPISAYVFHSFSVVSPVANLIVVPIAGMAFVPLSLAGALGQVLTGKFVTAPLVEPLARSILYLTGTFARIPFAEVPVSGFPPGMLILYYLSAVCAWTLRRRAILAGAALAVLIVAGVQLRGGGGLSLTFLDAGKADAIVAELPDGKLMVVDTGVSGREVESYLRYLGRRRIDALVLTHAHADHAGGLARLVSRFDVREVWDSGRLIYAPGVLPARTVRRALGRGDMVSGEGYEITVLHPYEGFLSPAKRGDDGVNNESLVMKIRSGGLAALLTGDVEVEAIEDMLALGPVLRAQVLKAPHHGRNSLGIDELYAAVQPELTIVTGWGENEAVRRAVGGGGLLETARDGAVRVDMAGGGVRVRRYADYTLRPARAARDEAGNFSRLFRYW